jgi:hypothetical protein
VELNKLRGVFFPVHVPDVLTFEGHFVPFVVGAFVNDCFHLEEFAQLVRFFHGPRIHELATASHNIGDEYFPVEIENGGRLASPAVCLSKGL